MEGLADAQEYFSIHHPDSKVVPVVNAADFIEKVAKHDFSQFDRVVIYAESNSTAIWFGTKMSFGIAVQFGGGGIDVDSSAFAALAAKWKPGSPVSFIACNCGRALSGELALKYGWVVYSPVGKVQFAAEPQKSIQRILVDEDLKPSQYFRFSKP